MTSGTTVANLSRYHPDCCRSSHSVVLYQAPGHGNGALRISLHNNRLGEICSGRRRILASTPAHTSRRLSEVTIDSPSAFIAFQMLLLIFDCTGFDCLCQ